MEQQQKLDGLLAQADAAERELQAMGDVMCGFGDVELLVSFDDLTVQTTSVIDGSFGGYLAALRV